MYIGYARVSTKEQNLDMQINELKKVGCEKIFTDISSGASSDRKGLDEAISFARKNDVIVVWKLDRAGRSLKHLIELVNNFNVASIGFKSLKEDIDTTTPTGRLMFHIFASLAEFERDIIRERTMAGLNAARSRGKLGGRPRKMTDKKLEMARSMMGNKDISIMEICKTLEVSKSTLYKHLKSN